jgi:glutamine amidotransferase
MCELFGVSSDTPLDLAGPLAAFRERGGRAANHADGWGIAHFDGERFAICKEPSAAADSPRFLECALALRSRLVLAHVRKATHPRLNTLENTHPFSRRCCAREWVFAHNGTVAAMLSEPELAPEAPERLDGDTDSEYAFHVLMDRLSRRYCDPHRDTDFVELERTIARIAAHGRFNFLLSDGVHLFAYGHDKLHERVWELPEGATATLVATHPLDDGSWTPFATGDLRVYRAGRLVSRRFIEPAPARPTAASRSLSV